MSTKVPIFYLTGSLVVAVSLFKVLLQMFLHGHGFKFRNVLVDLFQDNDDKRLHKSSKAWCMLLLCFNVLQYTPYVYNGNAVWSDMTHIDNNVNYESSTVNITYYIYVLKWWINEYSNIQNRSWN